MKRLFIITLLTGLCCNGSARAMNVYRVGDPIEGRSYVDVLKRWTPRSLSLWVGSEKGKDFLFFEGETGLKAATVMIPYNKQVQANLEKILDKSLKWADVAKVNNADTEKPLACFGRDEYNLCAKHGSSYKSNQLAFRFYAANGGQQTDLIVDIKDRDNEFYAEKIYLGYQAIVHFKKVVGRIPESLKKAHETGAKQDLFK